jgi:S-DNA-T family DNA segregation ATPase FtsK/SpoIIIE
VKREVIGVLLIAAGLLILLSLVSFVPGDAKSIAASGAAGNQPKNMIGSVGALTAAACFFMVGGAAYLFPILLGLLGARCFTPIPLTMRLRNAGSGLAAMVFLSALLHLEVTAVPTISSGWVNRGLAGGIIGQVLADGVRSYFATTGAAYRDPHRLDGGAPVYSAAVADGAVATSSGLVGGRARANGRAGTGVADEAGGGPAQACP